MLHALLRLPSPGFPNDMRTGNAGIDAYLATLDRTLAGSAAVRLSALRGYTDDAGSVERALRRLRGRGQALYTVLAYGLPGVVGALAGGALGDAAAMPVRGMIKHYRPEFVAKLGIQAVKPALAAIKNEAAAATGVGA